jgi:hypothetical protein
MLLEFLYLLDQTYLIHHISNLHSLHIQVPHPTHWTFYLQQQSKHFLNLISGHNIPFEGFGRFSAKMTHNLRTDTVRTLPLSALFLVCGARPITVRFCFRTTIGKFLQQRKKHRKLPFRASCQTLTFCTSPSDLSCPKMYFALFRGDR